MIVELTDQCSFMMPKATPQSCGRQIVCSAGMLAISFDIDDIVPVKAGMGRVRRGRGAL